MDRQSSEDSFEQLLERFCIDRLSDDQWRLLAANLAADEHALQSYVEAAHWGQTVDRWQGGSEGQNRHFYRAPIHPHTWWQDHSQHAPQTAHR